MNTQRTNEQIAQTLTQYLMGGSCYAEVTTEETKALILAALNEATAERDREIERLRDAMDHFSNHGIPLYAYGDNQAAVEFANRLETLSEIARTP